eukprot:742170-Amphidinium_carterae.1
MAPPSETTRVPNEPPVLSLGAAKAGMFSSAAGATAGATAAMGVAAIPTALGHPGFGVAVGGQTWYSVYGRVRDWAMDKLALVQKCSTCSRDFPTTKRVPPYFCEECRDPENQGSGASIFDIFVGCCSLGGGIGH